MKTKPETIDELFKELGIEMEVRTGYQLSADYIHIEHEGEIFKEDLIDYDMKFGGSKPKELTRDDVITRLREIAIGKVVPVALEEELFNVEEFYIAKLFKCGDMKFIVEKRSGAPEYKDNSQYIYIYKINSEQLCDILEGNQHLYNVTDRSKREHYDVLTYEEWLQVCIAFLTAKKQVDEDES